MLNADPVHHQHIYLEMRVGVGVGVGGGVGGVGGGWVGGGGGGGGGLLREMSYSIAEQGPNVIRKSIQNSSYLIEVETKWLMFYRWHFYKHLLKWKC